MIGKIPATLVLLMLMATSGCSAETGVNQKNEPSKIFQDFATKKKNAAKFWELYELGLEYQKQGNFGEAVKSFESGIKDYALLRPEQSAAAKQLVITLELAGNYEKAIKYCEVGAEVTMNEDQRKYFNDMKAKLQQAIASRDQG